MGGCLPRSFQTKSQMPLIARIRRRREMTFLARTRRRLQKMSPYLSLALLLVPLLLVEPLKLVAVFIAGKGHWLTGTGMLIGAYAVSLLFVERLFRMIKPKLMTLGWFARFGLPRFAPKSFHGQVKRPWQPTGRFEFPVRRVGC
jgi:hypothetical protein